MTLEHKSIELFWQSFKKENSHTAKEILIHHYLPFVNQIVNRLKISLPGNITKDELLSYGIFGLFDAIGKFDINKGFKFETYAFPRIKGAILDGLRAMDWLPAGLRQQEKNLVKSIGELEQALGRTANDYEIAEELGMSCKEFSKLLDKLNCTTLISLDQMISPHGEESISFLELLSDSPEKEPEAVIDQIEVKNILIEAANKLPAKEKMVIALYYYEGLNLKEISKLMNLSESRISQLHTKAIFRLRGRLSRQKKVIL